MKRTIRLTEGRLRRMIREAVEAEMNNGGINNAELEQRLADGEGPQDVFDRVYGTRDGDLFKVYFNNKGNYITKDGHIISEQWFDDVFDFVNGYATVLLGDKVNLINKQGELVCDTWFDRMYDLWLYEKQLMSN